MDNMKEMKNEEALNALADMLDPLSAIFTDEEIQKANDNKEPMIKIVKLAIKRHTREVLEVLAISEGVPVEEYTCTMFTLPKKVMNLINNEEVRSLFL